VGLKAAQLAQQGPELLLLLPKEWLSRLNSKSCCCLAAVAS
jgi:hypothetical protein